MFVSNSPELACLAVTTSLGTAFGIAVNLHGFAPCDEENFLSVGVSTVESGR